MGLNQEGSLVLGKLVRGDSFPGTVQNFLREQAKTARSMPDASIGRKRQAAALDALADHVSRLTLEHQVLRVLQAAHTVHGRAVAREYIPTPSQRAFCSRIGLDHPALTAVECREEFVAAAVVTWP